MTTKPTPAKKVMARLMFLVPREHIGGCDLLFTRTQSRTHTTKKLSPVAILDISDVEALVEKVLSDEIRHDFKEPLKDIGARFPDAVQKYREQVRRFLRSLGIEKGRAK